MFKIKVYFNWFCFSTIRHLLNILFIPFSVNDNCILLFTWKCKSSRIVFFNFFYQTLSGLMKKMIYEQNSRFFPISLPEFNESCKVNNSFEWWWVISEFRRIELFVRSSLYWKYKQQLVNFSNSFERPFHRKFNWFSQRILGIKINPWKKLK